MSKNTICRTEENNPRPPLSPALLAQAAGVERGVCFGYDEATHAMGEAIPSERGQAIVTWKGREAGDAAGQAEK